MVLNKRSYNQIYEFTLAAMKSRYRNTIAGVVWVMFNPILMFAAQSIIFKYVLKIQIPNYFLFLLGGLLPWIFMTSTINMTSSILINNGEILKSYNLSPSIFIFSQVLDNFINFILSFLLLFLGLAFLTDLPLTGFVFSPIMLILLFVGTTSMSFLVAVLNVFYRDTKFIIEFLLSIFYFVTPIFYAEEFIPKSYRFLVDFNPFYGILRPFRTSIYQGHHELLLEHFSKGALWVLALSLLAHFYWKKNKNSIYLYI